MKKPAITVTSFLIRTLIVCFALAAIVLLHWMVTPLCVIGVIVLNKIYDFVEDSERGAKSRSVEKD